MLLPLTGNPHHYSACIAHPSTVLSLACSSDGSRLFTSVCLAGLPRSDTRAGCGWQRACVVHLCRQCGGGGAAGRREPGALYQHA